MCENDEPPSPAVSELSGYRRRHRSAISPAALSSGEIPWHGIENRPTEDVQAKLRSRHRSSIDDRRLTIDMDDPNRDLQGRHYAVSEIRIVCFEKPKSTLIFRA